MAHATVTERCNQASADVPRQPSGRIRRRPPGGRCGAAAADHPGYTISAFGSSSTSTSISAPWPAGRTPATSSSRSSCQPSPVATRSMTRTVRGRGSLRTRSANDWPEEWRQWRNEPHSLALEGRETLRELNARVAAVLDELACSSAASGAVVVYTHGAMVRAAVAWALRSGTRGLPARRGRQQLHHEATRPRRRAPAGAGQRGRPPRTARSRGRPTARARTGRPRRPGSDGQRPAASGGRARRAGRGR